MAPTLDASDASDLFLALLLGGLALALLLGFTGFGNLLAALWGVVSLAAAVVTLYLLYRAVVALERLARAHERLADAREE